MSTQAAAVAGVVPTAQQFWEQLRVVARARAEHYMHSLLFSITSGARFSESDTNKLETVEL